MDRVIARPVIASMRTIAVSKPGIRVLELLLLAHLVLVVFQVPLRGVVFDTTFYRDILLVVSVGLWALTMLRNRSKKNRLGVNLLDRLFALYLFYGLVTVLVALINNVGPVDAMTQFRNTFLPAALYFVAKRAFETSEAQSRLVNLFLIITVLLILDVIGEFLVQQAGYPLATIPWYPYIFKTNYRFIGNEVGAIGYILPENSPILGVLGYPHYTVATLVALFAFSYPFLIEKHLKDIFGGGSRLIARLPAWTRQGIGLSAIIAVFILGVRTHLVSAIFVLMVLPFFTRPRVLLRNLLILCVAGIILITAGLLEPGYVERVTDAFFGSGTRDSSLSIILSVTELRFLASSPLPRLLFGNADISSQVFGEVGAFELKLLFFTAAYGLVWLISFLGIYVAGLFYSRKIMVERNVPPMARLFAMGTIGLLAVYILDMGHYARTMWTPNIDIWIVILGTISAIVTQIPKGIQSVQRTERYR